MIRATSAAALMLPWAAGCCMHFEGQARNPGFDGPAPDPTVMVAPVVCRAGRASPPGDSVEVQFRATVKARMPVEQVELDPEQQAMVCGEIGRGWGMVFGPGRRWWGGPVVASVAEAVAMKKQARSIVFTIVEAAPRPGDAAPTDEQFEPSGETTMLRAYLVSPEGFIYWKSWSVVRTNDPGRVEDGVGSLYFGMPARLGVAGEAPPGAGPPMGPPPGAEAPPGPPPEAPPAAPPQ
jgi:hypothetical protein